MLSRSFDGVPAVEALSFEIPEGSLFTLLGPNGAGKTTTVRLLLGLIAPDSGTASVAGYELGQSNNALRRVCGLLTETPGFYDRMSAWENLTFFAQLYRIPETICDQRLLEFLIGKLLASLVPSIILTWAAAIIAAVIVNSITWGSYETALLPERFWFVGLFVLAPLMGMASVLAAIRLSAKMSDPQTANQFTGLVIVPAFIILIGIFGKILTISMSAVAIACVLVILLVLFLLRLNLKNFQREEILTRWK